MSLSRSSQAVTERAERIVDAILDNTVPTRGHRADDRRATVDVVADALEELLGPVELDRVTGEPLTVWDRLVDLATRLRRLERGDIPERVAYDGTPIAPLVGMRLPIEDATGAALKVGDNVLIAESTMLVRAAVAGFLGGCDDEVLIDTRDTGNGAARVTRPARDLVLLSKD